jgi:hypothetical protein
MGNKNQTAVEWLFEQIRKDIIGLEYDYADALEKAKSIEQKQHMDTWFDSRENDRGDNYIGKEISFPEYWNQTFPSNS